MATRAPIGPVANGRNHTVTGIAVAFVASKLFGAFPSLGELEWQVIVGTVLGGGVAFGASLLRSFTATLQADGGESLAARWGHRLAGYLGCFAAALLLSGCATPFMVVGDAYYWRCGGQAVVDAESGDVTCDGTLVELRGGHISEAGAATLGVPIAIGRAVAGAAVGVP